ncbi:MAG: hypothetical protein HYS87_01605 [Candidatus Colwellbacteria bacterium]|nr:hypothetical protein [Candidatus Colwellbacteria bacterium]
MKTKLVFLAALAVFAGSLLGVGISYAVPGFFTQGGNSFLETAVLGTTDNFDLSIITNNTELARFDTSGTFNVNGDADISGSLINALHNHENNTGGSQLNATNVFSSGIVPTARLGSGTADSAKFLRGDQTWATPPSPANMQIFTSDGTWIKPTGAKLVLVEMWGGGGGGGRQDPNIIGSGGGGGGGAYSTKLFRADDLGSTESVLVGSGGLAGTTGNPPGEVGEKSSFAGLEAYGGGGGGGGDGNSTTHHGGGGGGGTRSAGSVGGVGTNASGGDGGAPNYAFGTTKLGAGAPGGSDVDATANIEGGGGGGGVNGGNLTGAASGATFGGGGGGAGGGTGGEQLGGAGASSQYGGGGGGGGHRGSSAAYSGGSSINGGSGGTGSKIGADATPGSIPGGGGGGGGAQDPAAGARGEVRVYSW